MPTVELLGRLEPGTSRWAAARRNRLGGSEVAAALGLSPWCSPFTLWHRKRGLIGESDESPSMYWGKLVEPVIWREWLRRHPDWDDGDHSPEVGRSFAEDWRIAAPDVARYNYQTKTHDALLEIKTADKDDAFEWGEDGSADPAAIPPYYRVQCLWYMDILGVRDMYVVVLIGGNDYREYVVPWDQAEADDIRERAAAFWRTVEDNVRPHIDASTSTYETVRELHPDIDGESKEVPADVADEYLTTDLQLKGAKTEAQKAKTRLLDAMGTARLATVAGEVIARRQPGRNGSISLYPIHPKENQ